MKRKAAFFPALVLATTLVVGPVSAATINVSTQGSNAFRDASGANSWYQSTTFNMNGTHRNVVAGMFRLKATDMGGSMTNFLAFCLQPLEILTLPKAHVAATSLSRPVVDRLGTLMSNAFSGVTNASTAAAFQMAVWEIANESSGALNLSHGMFQITAGNTTTRALAQSWLSKISDGSWSNTQRVTILSASGTQDLLTDMAPVPVPAAGFALIGGLLSLAGLKRRRRKA